MQMEVKYKPRIAVDARPLAYGLTGNSRYLFEALKYLIRKDSHFEYYLYSNKEIHPMFMDFIKLNNVTVVVPMKTIPGVIWLNFVLPYYLHRDRIDMLWGTLQLLPYFKLPMPEFVNYHDLNFRSAPETMTRANFIQHKLLSPKTLRNADTVFCLSKNTKKEIAEFRPEYAKKLKVIYPGVSKKVISNNELAIEGKFLFTIGTLEPRKNISTVIEAYLDLKKEKPDFDYKLVIASSDIPVFREILESGTDILVNPRATSEWKEAILTITNRDSIKRRRIWDEKQWTWLATASQIEESFLIEWHKRLGSSV